MTYRILWKPGDLYDSEWSTLHEVAGYDTALDEMYAPHGVENNTWLRILDDRKIHRTGLFLDGIVLDLDEEYDNHIGSEDLREDIAFREDRSYLEFICERKHIEHVLYFAEYAQVDKAVVSKALYHVVQYAFDRIGTTRSGTRWLWKAKRFLYEGEPFGETIHEDHSHDYNKIDRAVFNMITYIDPHGTDELFRSLEYATEYVVENLRDSMKNTNYREDLMNIVRREIPLSVMMRGLLK